MMRTASGMKQCSKCKILKGMDFFYTCKVVKDGRRSICIDCIKEDRLSYKDLILYNAKKINGEKVIARTKGYQKDISLKKRYGISLDDYLNLVEIQDNKCAICKKPETVITRFGITKTLAVDHCHKTGKVRGLLCSFCNQGLGTFKDDIQVMEEAIKYLKRNC